MADSVMRAKSAKALRAKPCHGEAGSRDEPRIYDLTHPTSYAVNMLRELLRGCIFGLLDVHTIILTMIACVATFLSSSKMFDLQFDTEETLLSMGTIFPIVFTISQSYTRREQALAYMSDIKASILGLYWIHRDFNSNPAVAPQVAAASIHYLDCLKLLLRPDTPDRQEALKGMYAALSSINLLNWEMLCNEATAHKPVCPPTHGSRASQYIRYLVAAGEKLRVIRDYRTPQGLRLFAQFVLHLLAIVMGPRFQSYCESGKENYGCLDGYFTAVVFFLVVLTLYHVQEDLEDPFDGDGWDDINLDIRTEIILFMTLHPDPKLIEHPTLAPETVDAMRKASVYIPHGEDTFSSFDPSALPQDE